jgi:hypothetical protein
MSVTVALDDEFIRVQRLRNQQLSHHDFRRPEDLLEWMGAIQAQDRSASLWAMGIRLPETTIQSLEAAVSRKAIVRSWVPRGTLHWCAADDLRWLLELLAPRIISRSAPRLRQLGITPGQIERSEAALDKAMKKSLVITRDQALAAIEAAGVSVIGQRGYHLLHRAE